MLEWWNLHLTGEDLLKTGVNKKFHVADSELQPFTMGRFFFPTIQCGKANPMSHWEWLVSYAYLLRDGLLYVIIIYNDYYSLLYYYS